MLQLTIPKSEAYDERSNTFITLKNDCTLLLEHSLYSISKWEEHWEKPFLTTDNKTTEESIDYVRCMTINDVDPVVYFFLGPEAFSAIDEYIARPMTATTIRDMHARRRGREIITSEIIYYLMFSYNIPIECEKWNLNKLITLIQVFNLKNSPPKKMSKSEALRQQRSLNEARKAKWHTKG